MDLLILFAAACRPGAGFSLGLPTWYQYLECTNSAPQINELNDILLIGAAIIEILIFVAGVLTVFWMIYGGIAFITSQGAPDRVAQARQTLIYAAAGLVVAVVAKGIVSYIFSQFGVQG
ncbi:MAG TPA: hypothetical protein VGA08_02545 [Candidatus Saccharimonadales bacterium]